MQGKNGHIFLYKVSCDLHVKYYEHRFYPGLAGASSHQCNAQTILPACLPYTKLTVQLRG